jgi:hypothetical protein
MQLRFVRDSSFSRDGFTPVDAPAGTIHDVPEPVARSLVAGGAALPVDDAPDDFPSYGGDRGARADRVLRKHKLSVHDAPNDDDVRRLQARHDDVQAEARKAGAEHRAATDRLNTLRERHRAARVAELSGEDGPEAPDADELEDAAAEAEAARERLDVAEEAAGRVGEMLRDALTEAEARRRDEAREAHAALLRKGVDRARKFRALLDDLQQFEDAYKRVLPRTVSGATEPKKFTERATRALP